MIQASEDIGNADPTALLVAEAAFKAAEVIGYPECRINLAQAAIYNALAPKSNAAEAAIDAALADVRTSGQREVPSYLRDRHRPGSDEYGKYSTRMITSRAGWPSATCRRAWSPERSGTRAAVAGSSGEPRIAPANGKGVTFFRLSFFGLHGARAWALLALRSLRAPPPRPRLGFCSVSPDWHGGSTGPSG